MALKPKSGINRYQSRRRYAIARKYVILIYYTYYISQMLNGIFTTNFNISINLNKHTALGKQHLLRAECQL